MKFNQMTIKDIARELGISPSTVSRALKDHPDISIATKKAVNELADKLNYQPNTVALNLRQRKTNTIGVIIPEIVHFFFSIKTRRAGTNKKHTGVFFFQTHQVMKGFGFFTRG